MPDKFSLQTVDTPSEKTAEPKIDLFHPEMPQIPGVSESARESGRDSTAKKRTPAPRNAGENRRRLQIGGIVAGAVLLVLMMLWWAISKPRGGTKPTSSTDAGDQTAPASPAEDTTAPIEDGPVVAAKIEELSKPWSAKKFVFVKPITRENINAMVIRLPGEGLWAFSLQEPYGRCNLEYVTNLATLASKYGYNAGHPMVVDPCDSTVYDPLKVGSLGGDTYARGGIVQGSGLRPPLAIDVKVTGRTVIADSIE